MTVKIRFDDFVVLQFTTILLKRAKVNGFLFLCIVLSVYRYSWSIYIRFDPLA